MTDLSRATRADPPGQTVMTHLMQRTHALILAGGKGTRLQQLTARRAKPAVPFAGMLRIIDFALSNCVNSGVRRIGVLTQYKAHSLIRHIERGWGFLAANMGEFIDIMPAQQQVGDQWYRGTADAVFQNLDILQEVGADYVLILAGDHVYQMDYARLLADHVTRGADVTVATVEVPVEDASALGVIAIDGEGRVTRFEEKPAAPPALPGHPGRSLASMGIYVFGRPFLEDVLRHDAADVGSSHDFGRDLLPRLVAHHRVVAHRFEDSCVNMGNNRPYWRDVGTIDAFWAANIDLVRVAPELNLYDDRWPIFSQQRQLPPAKFEIDEQGRAGIAIGSLVSAGCIVRGALVRGSILFSKVRIGEGSEVVESVLLPNAVAGRAVKLRRTVVDAHCVLPDGFCAGWDLQQDRRRFHVSDHGITLVAPEMLGQQMRWN